MNDYEATISYLLIICYICSIVVGLIVPVSSEEFIICGPSFNSHSNSLEQVALHHFMLSQP